MSAGGVGRPSGRTADQAGATPGTRRREPAGKEADIESSGRSVPLEGKEQRETETAEARQAWESGCKVAPAASSATRRTGGPTSRELRCGWEKRIEAERQKKKRKELWMRSRPGHGRLLREPVAGQGATQAWDAVEGDAGQQVPMIVVITDWELCSVNSTGNSTAVPFREDQDE